MHLVSFGIRFFSYFLPRANVELALKRLILIAFCLFCVAAYSQDTLLLKEVQAVAVKPGFTEVGKKQQSIDSTTISSYQGKHLGDIIGAESAIALKAYGVNGIVGAAMRGTSVDQTAVIWNGVNLQSPTHGQFDLSLLPVFFTDRISIEPGAGTGAYGSGAVGGSIVLGNNINKNQSLGTKLYLGGGSYGNRQLGAGVSFNTKKLYSDTRVFYHTAENNFEIKKFYLPENNKYYLLSTPHKQQHSSFLQQGIMQQLTYQLSENSTLSNILLHTTADRLLINSNGRQLDDDLRNVTTYNLRKERFEFLTTVGVQREIIRYTDTISSIESFSKSISGWLQAGGKFQLSENQHLYGYINPQLITAEVDGYGASKPTQRRMSAWAGWNRKWLDKRLTSDVSLKQQWINEKSLPIIPAVGLNYSLLSGLIVKAHSSSVFHAPDFNDLYWVAGGNPNLLPEEGWSHELGLQSVQNQLTAEVTVFQNRVKNLIVWLPSASFYSPINVREVRSQGLELNLKAWKQLGSFRLNADVSYSHTNAITTKSLKVDDLTVGKQQLYIPTDNASGRINTTYKSWILGLHAHYNGLRFIATDNSNWLPAYTIVDARLSKTLSWRGCKAAVFVAANNLSGKFYMNLPGYAMPGRNYETGITLNFNK